MSRYRNKGKDDEDAYESESKKAVSDRSIRMSQAMQRLDFATKPVDEQIRLRSDYEEEH